MSPNWFLERDSVVDGSSTDIVYYLFVCPTRLTCFVHPILILSIAIKVIGDDCILLKFFLRQFSRVTCYILYPRLKCLLRILFSHTLSRCSSIPNQEVSNPYKTRGVSSTRRGTKVRRGIPLFQPVSAASR
jgi:hypothetical protein